MNKNGTFEQIPKGSRGAGLEFGGRTSQAEGTGNARCWGLNMPRLFKGQQDNH